MKFIQVHLLTLMLTFSPFTINGQNNDTSLIALYTFDGNAEDISGNQNHGIVNGAILSTDRFGNQNCAYEFDGIDDYIQIDSQVISSKEFSISFWSKTNQFKSHLAFMLVPDNTSDRLAIHVNYNHNGDTSIFYDFGDISGNGRLYDLPLPTLVREWEHYTFVTSNSADSMLIYRNGALTKSVDYSDNIQDTMRALRIGSGFNANYFSGKLDDIHIFNRALSSSEILSDYTTSTINPATNAQVFVHDDSGNPKAGIYIDKNGKGVVFGDIKNFRIPNPLDEMTDIVYASLEGPEAAIYLRGSGSIKKGKGNIKFPKHFRLLVNAKTITIQLTPKSEKSKGLAVIESGQSGFIVKELFNGKGNYQFNWEVKGIRKGFEDMKVIAKKIEP